MTRTSAERRPGGAFRHEALLYRGDAGFLGGTVPFVRAAVAAGEPVLVVVDAAKLGRLRSALGADAGAVHFADMAVVGDNPARIIPAWSRFVDEHAGGGRRPRGIGEPIGPGRGPAELVECQRHEQLLNLAFADAPAWWLLCPYDTGALPPAVIQEALRSHPFVAHGGARRAGDDRGAAAAAPFDAPLPEPPGDPAELAFAAGPLGDLRAFVARHAVRGGLGAHAAADLVLAADEVASNSVRHGGGRGTLRIWGDDGAVVCEIRDAGRLDDPLAGRHIPPLDGDSGRGLWLANQLRDLVQLRTLPGGTVVRLHMRRPAGARA